LEEEDTRRGFSKHFQLNIINNNVREKKMIKDQKVERYF